MSSSTNVPVHGNYHGYYSKRPSVKDPRLAVLPASLLQGARVLDVGCNEGWVTCEIAQSWGVLSVVGVDIDDTLIRAAWRRRRTVWSLQEPSDSTMVAGDINVSDHPKKRKREPSSPPPPPPPPPPDVARLSQPDYFPASCEHTFGPLPIPPSQNRGKHIFPHNISFRTADWTTYEIPEDAEGYDVVIAFSISKWIHLNGGDVALEHFFRRVHAVLKPGGTFVLEPQAWDTYAKAKRMDERLKENAKGLKLHPEQFESVLAEMGFGPPQHLGTIGEGGFRRPVDLYVKQ